MKPKDFRLVCPCGDNKYIAKSAAPGTALRATVSPYSAPTVSSGGSPTDLYFDDALTIARAPEQ